MKADWDEYKLFEVVLLSLTNQDSSFFRFQRVKFKAGLDAYVSCLGALKTEKYLRGTCLIHAEEGRVS